jgi:hypothetical protein
MFVAYEKKRKCLHKANMVSIFFCMHVYSPNFNQFSSIFLTMLALNNNGTKAYTPTPCTDERKLY